VGFEEIRKSEIHLIAAVRGISTIVANKPKPIVEEKPADMKPVETAESGSLGEKPKLRRGRGRPKKRV